MAGAGWGLHTERVNAPPKAYNHVLRLLITPKETQPQDFEADVAPMSLCETCEQVGESTRVYVVEGMKEMGK